MEDDIIEMKVDLKQGKLYFDILRGEEVLQINPVLIIPEIIRGDDYPEDQKQSVFICNKMFWKGSEMH